MINSSGRMKANHQTYDIQDVNPAVNWKSRAAETKVYAPRQGAEHEGKYKFKV